MFHSPRNKSEFWVGKKKIREAFCGIDANKMHGI